ncbi:hypothetical protein [Pseudogracilibacillus sp. SO30301A]|uniref:hypothetical protein n=1 Tax=Pseudogracilibacillus sp. SO30301A TaxID=3098291 RepID=UPI00300E0D5C
MKKMRGIVVCKQFWKDVFLLPGCLFSFSTVALTFLTEVSFVQYYKVFLLVLFLRISVLSILFLLLYKMSIQSVKLTINHSIVEIRDWRHI